MEDNGIQDYFLWENQEWPFLNLDNLSGGSDEKLGTSIPDSNVFDGQSPQLPELVVKPSTSRKRSVPLHNNGDGNDQGNKEKASGGNGEHERYLLIEREKRKKIKNMFTILQTLLPQLPHKVDRSTVVDETIKHIKTLEHTLNDLQKQKMERLQCTEIGPNMGITKMATRDTISAPDFPIAFKTWTFPNISLNVCENDAHISICCSAKSGLLASICSILEKYKIEAVSVHVSSDNNRRMYMIHARVTSGYQCQIPAEDIYKQAAQEIMIICG